MEDSHSTAEASGAPRSLYPLVLDNIVASSDHRQSFGHAEFVRKIKKDL